MVVWDIVLCTLDVLGVVSFFEQTILFVSEIVMALVVILVRIDEFLVY